MATKNSTARKKMGRQEKALDRCFTAVEASPALLTQDEINKFEADFEGVSNRRARRFGLLVVSESGSDLIRRVERDRETAIAFAAAVSPLDEYAKRIEALGKTLQAAHARLIVALAYREDMNEVLAEAERLNTSNNVIQFPRGAV